MQIKLFQMFELSIHGVLFGKKLKCIILCLQTECVTQFLQCCMLFQAQRRQKTEQQLSTRVSRASRSATEWQHQMLSAMARCGRRLTIRAKVVLFGLSSFIIIFKLHEGRFMATRLMTEHSKFEFSRQRLAIQIVVRLFRYDLS